METQFVRVLCDVYCDWEGLPPNYRLFVNDELFTERTWIWNERYLEEMIQIEAPPGRYSIRYELVSPHLANLTAQNMRVDYGPASLKDNVLTIRSLPLEDQS